MKTVDFKLIGNELITRNHLKNVIVRRWRALCAIAKSENETPFHLKATQ